MELEDDNARLMEHLESLQEAAERADGDSVSEFLSLLREDDFDSDSLQKAESLLDDGQFDALVEWSGKHLFEMGPEENPFAGDFDFDVDDAFLDVEDTGFREPSDDALEVDPGELLADLEADDGIEVLSESELSTASSAESASAVQKPGRPHVLSGKFNLVDKNAVDDDTEERSLVDSLDEAAREADDEPEQDPDKQTRPNVTPDLADIETGAGQPEDDEETFESGVSQVRYQAAEPAPPIHRLPATSDISGEIATIPPDVGEEDTPNGGVFRSLTDESEPDEPPSDEISIEILHEPDSEVSEGSEAEPSEGEDEPLALEAKGGFDFGFDDAAFDEDEEDEEHEEDDDEFEIELIEEPESDEELDLGLQNPEERATGGDAAETKPGPDEEVDTAERDRNLTPLRTLPAQDPEDMFFELAEALAAESSEAEQYRGEPLRAHSAETNPFGNDEPTGTGHSPLAAGESVSAAAQSHVQTNMNAILLEARRLRSAGELGAALDITKKVLSRGANRDAESLKDEIEGQLESDHLETLGELSQTPTLAVELNDLANLDLDHRAGYIISQVDGTMSYADLIELSGMSRLETLSVISQLVQQGVIEP